MLLEMLFYQLYCVIKDLIRAQLCTMSDNKHFHVTSPLYSNVLRLLRCCDHIEIANIILALPLLSIMFLIPRNLSSCVIYYEVAVPFRFAEKSTEYLLSLLNVPTKSKLRKQNTNWTQRWRTVGTWDKGRRQICYMWKKAGPCSIKVRSPVLKEMCLLHSRALFH